MVGLSVSQVSVMVKKWTTKLWLAGWSLITYWSQALDRIWKNDIADTSDQIRFSHRAGDLTLPTRKAQVLLTKTSLVKGNYPGKTPKCFHFQQGSGFTGSERSAPLCVCSPVSTVLCIISSSVYTILRALRCGPLHQSGSSPGSVCVHSLTL